MRASTTQSDPSLVDPGDAAGVRVETVADVVPPGWYAVAQSADLGRGDVQRAVFDGQALVVFRGDDGAVGILHAPCPHRGADLSLGRVRGRHLVCGFHGLRVSADGACHGPDALDGCADLNAQSWPVLERNGLVCLWHGDGPPAWEPEAYPELLDPAWAPLCWSEPMVFDAPLSVFSLDAVDEAHGWLLHQARFELDAVQEGPVLRVAQCIRRGEGTMRELVGRLDVAWWGAGIVTYRGTLAWLGRPLWPHVYVQSCTPVGDGRVAVRIGIAMRRSRVPGWTASLLRRFVDEAVEGYEAHRAVWESLPRTQRLAFGPRQPQLGVWHGWFCDLQAGVGP